jgi:hypothetical protein
MGVKEVHIVWQLNPAFSLGRQGVRFALTMDDGWIAIPEVKESI